MSSLFSHVYDNFTLPHIRALQNGCAGS